MLDEVRHAIDSMPEAERWGSLCFFGEWFGGRPYENQHALTSVQLEDNSVVLGFDGGETLSVWEPSGVAVTVHGLRIARATRVKWEWFYYGRPQTPENRFSIDYRVDGDGSISVTDTADWFEPRHQPDSCADAVALLR
jgi:hypothetical protein